MRRLCVSLLLVLAVAFTAVGQAAAETTDYSRAEVFDFLQEASDKQWNTPGPFETKRELQDEFSSHFLREYTDFFIEEMYWKQFGQWEIIPTDALIGFIPEFSYNSSTDVEYTDNEIIVSEYFPFRDGPMIRPAGTRTVTLVETSSGLRVKNVNDAVTYGNKLFADVENDYFAYDEISYLTDEGIIGGYPDGTFRPNDSLKRAQAVIMIARALDWDLSSSATDFSDVDSDYYAADAIAYASSNDVLNGYPDGTFRPNNSITRAQMSAILGKAFSLGTDASGPFRDVTENTTGQGEINQLYNLGIISGYDNNTRFNPNEPLTRAQFSIILSRLLNDDLRLAGEEQAEAEEEATPAFVIEYGLKNGKVVNVTPDTDPIVVEKGQRITLEPTFLDDTTERVLVDGSLFEFEDQYTMYATKTGSGYINIIPNAYDWEEAKEITVIVE
ncbi:DUF3993 domain-containing protein [Alteribacillus iranensis]|uniref:S-layer homology domain-containing protein n=1 Tax=Alteribacillus iranensis TaxID=930128 RepID=A0A1I2BB99_9BACI|nr:DUF3993 domain-containing protein [Alteribacillus iranensis]SFE53366.1 S-layer homology domain-containing protein [Alteribacillus iranensis]